MHYYVARQMLTHTLVFQIFKLGFHIFSLLFLDLLLGYFDLGLKNVYNFFGSQDTYFEQCSKHCSNTEYIVQTMNFLFEN